MEGRTEQKTMPVNLASMRMKENMPTFLRKGYEAKHYSSKDANNLKSMENVNKDTREQYNKRKVV